MVKPWNGIIFFLFPTLETLSDFAVCSDASGVIGYGAFMDNEWFNGRWSPLQLPLSIAYKELFPVVLVVHVWGPRWSRRCILFHVDNEAVVHILNSRTSKTQTLCTCCVEACQFFVQFYLCGCSCSRKT